MIKIDPIVIFIFLLVVIAFIVAGTITMVHKELNKKPILTKFMLTQLSWPKQKCAEFLIDKGYLKTAPPLAGRRMVSRLEANQRIKDDKQLIRNIEEETKDENRRLKFDRIHRVLIKDFYNLRGLAKDKYLMSRIKSTNFKYTYDYVMSDYPSKYSNKQLVEVTVTVEYSFIPIQQGNSYNNNEASGIDVKDFKFIYDEQNWLASGMIDFS